MHPAVNNFRVESKHAARQIHRAPGKRPAEEFVDPILVVAGAIQRREPLRPDVRQPRVLYIEEETQSHTDAPNHERNNDDHPPAPTLPPPPPFTPPAHL